MNPNTAQVVFQFDTPTPIPAPLRQTMADETKAKIARMDPTGVSSSWTFPVESGDPSIDDIVKKMNDCLDMLTQGDESLQAVGPTGTSTTWYCKVGDVWVCYTSAELIRTQASPDVLWGGNLGENSELAMLQGGCRIPLRIVHAFARTYAPGNN